MSFPLDSSSEEQTIDFYSNLAKLEPNRNNKKTAQKTKKELPALKISNSQRYLQKNLSFDKIKFNSKMNVNAAAI